MSDLLTSGTSTYTTSGTPDTQTPRSNGVGGSDIDAETVNGVAEAMVEAQTLLGNALTLKGDKTDLVSRLARILDSSGSVRKGTSFPSTPTPEEGDIFWRTDTDTFYIYDGATWRTAFEGLGASTIDHGSISGLGDDDHTLYLLATGARDLTGDQQIEKNDPALRLKGTEVSGQEFRLVETGGDVIIQENTGSEGTPVWVNRLQYDRSLTKWIATGDVQWSGTLQGGSIPTARINQDNGLVAGHLAPDSVGQSEIAASSVGTGELKLGTGSSTAAEFAVNQYAFASPLCDPSNAIAGSVLHSIGTGLHTDGSQREWTNTGAANKTSFTWDYVTSSENPSVWIQYDPLTDKIHHVWESEDPAYPRFPDRPPFTPESGLVVVQITDLLSSLTFWDEIRKWAVGTQALPQWHANSLYQNETNPQKVMEKMYEEKFRFYGKWEKEDLTDIRSVFLNNETTDQQKRWRLQIWAREISQFIDDHEAPTIIPLLQTRFTYAKNKLAVA